jgi:TctA family transporter
MIEALFEGLVLVLQWKPLLFMLAGIALGFWVGLLPGLGGATTLALMLPFIYTMQPVEAFAFLLGMHAVVATTGDITSVLFGVPGEATSAATILDGHAMAKKGQAGRALGAALASSFVGALIGAFALAAAIPIVRPLVLTFGSPELFMLAIVGIAFIASLSAPGPRGVLRGFLAGALGLLCATVGQDPQAGIARYTFDMLYLWNGLELVPVLVGVFAIPEIIDLAVRRTSIAGSLPAGRISKGALEGVKDTFRHFWLTIRCSLIGTFIGIMPGMGGAVAQWMAYGHATQSARGAEERKGFGAGDVRGVLGPGAANNSKEGGLLRGSRPAGEDHHGARRGADSGAGGIDLHRQLHLEQPLWRPARHPGLRRARLLHGAGRLAAGALRAGPRARQDRRKLSLYIGRALRRCVAHAAGGADPLCPRHRGYRVSDRSSEDSACIAARR